MPFTLTCLKEFNVQLNSRAHLSNGLKYWLQIKSQKAGRRKVGITRPIRFFITKSSDFLNWIKFKLINNEWQVKYKMTTFQISNEWNWTEPSLIMRDITVIHHNLTQTICRLWVWMYVLYVCVLCAKRDKNLTPSFLMLKLNTYVVENH